MRWACSTGSSGWLNSGCRKKEKCFRARRRGRLCSTAQWSTSSGCTYDHVSTPHGAFSLFEDPDGGAGTKGWHPISILASRQRAIDLPLSLPYMFMLTCACGVYIRVMVHQIVYDASRHVVIPATLDCTGTCLHQSKGTGLQNN